MQRSQGPFCPSVPCGVARTPCIIASRAAQRQPWLSRPRAAPPTLRPAAARPAAQQQWRRSVTTAAAAAGSGADELENRSAVAALLQQHGVDPAQLQRERPDAYAQLTLPLARLLVQWLAGREGVKTQSNSPSPAVVAGRLVHLAADWGLAPEDIDRIYVQQPVNHRFIEAGAREVLAWLRGYLPQPEQLRRVAQWHPRALRTRMPTLAASKAAVQQFFGLADDAQWAAAVHDAPGLLGFTGSMAGEVAAWLQSEAVGLSAPDVAKLRKLEPNMFGCSPSALSAGLDRLMRRLQIPNGTAAGSEGLAAGEQGGQRRKRPVQATLVLRSSSTVLLSEELLESRVAAFERYGFNAAGVGGVLLNAPIVLECDFDRTVLPALRELERLSGGRDAVERQALARNLALRGGSLILTPPTKLRRNFDYLCTPGLSEEEAQAAGLPEGASRSLGLTEEEARAVLFTAPQTFSLTLYGAGMRAKLAYLPEVLGASVRELLTQQATYLKEGLRKVDQRVFCMERHGQLHLLTQRDGTGRLQLAWMTLPAETFCTRFGVSKEEWAEAEREWVLSERAQRYGLVQEKVARFTVDKSAAAAGTKRGNAARRVRTAARKQAQQG